MDSALTAASPAEEAQSSRSAGPRDAPAAKMPRRLVVTVSSGGWMASMKPYLFWVRPRMPAMVRVPREGSMPTERTTMSISTSMGRPMVVSSPRTSSRSPFSRTSVMIPFTYWTWCCSWAGQ